jgi:hypothetical protein
MIMPMKNCFASSYLFLCFLVCSGCSNSDQPAEESVRRTNQRGEFVYRHQGEFLFAAAPADPQTPPTYPWEEGQSSNQLRITKEYFRCKGSILNPPRIVAENGKELQRYHDCGGAEKHSLPLRNNKEFIYPILIDLLNYIQNKSGKRVVVTSGHRCPDHNTYVDSSVQNSSSKHQVGAEVSFYVQGMENQPEQIVKYIIDYYKETSKYQGLKEYQEFSRFTKGETNVSTPPWMNKEVFVKVFNKKEGRDFDNRHPYPYLSIQVRYDWDLQEKVTVTWEKAYKNYLRF